MHKFVQSCSSLSSPMDCSLPGSSVCWIFQVRLLRWGAISYSRGSSQPKDQAHVSCISCIGRWILTTSATWETQIYIYLHKEIHAELYIYIYIYIHIYIYIYLHKEIHAELNIRNGSQIFPLEPLIRRWQGEIRALKAFSCSVPKLCPTLCDPMDYSTPAPCCPSVSPGVCSDSCPLSQWCSLTISSSAAFFFCLQSFPASGSFPMSWLFT